MTLELTNSQARTFRQALQKAYTARELDILLYERLNISREDVTLADNYSTRAHDIVGHANRRGYAFDLVLAAIQGNPDNAELFKLVDKLELGPNLIDELGTSIALDTLESIIKPKVEMFDIAQFRTQIGQIEGQVCRIDIAGTGMGTGFLVGPSAVLTNYHVVESVIDGIEKDTDIICRFDYKLLPNDTILNSGVPFEIEKVATHSPYDPAEIERLETLPDPKNLDYALLILKDEPGNLTIGGNYESGAIRNWIKLPEAEPAYAAKEPIIIVQHPSAGPMKFAFDSDGMVGLNENRTRVMYTTNTLRGSSGSPCFNQKLELIALHHSGDPGWQVVKSNRGVPICNIFRDLKEKGLEKHLDE